MRKIFITIILLVISLCLMAQEVDTLNINFALLNPEIINLELRIFAPMQRIYITADFSVDKDALPEATYYSIFFNERCYNRATYG